jgi:septal ring factor EnvC (AmiA/AmiB activator)
MTDEPVELDRHRGMAAQKSTELRRSLQEVQADQSALRARHEELEKFLLQAPAKTIQDVSAKARYLLELFAASQDASDPRRQRLIADVLADLERLGKNDPS